MPVHSLKILIADDEPLIRMDMKEILQEAGQQVVGEAADGLQALEMSRRVRPDLVIMDIRMPRMDGLKEAKLIIGEKIAPVMMLSAYSQEKLVQQACENGVIGYLVKPLEPKNFVVNLQMAYKTHCEMSQLKTNLARLREDLQTRKLVEQAKGLIMAKAGLTEKEAMQKIQRLSMAKGIPIKYTAQKIIAAYGGSK